MNGTTPTRMFINLTPHELVLFRGDQPERTWSKPEGPVPRVQTTYGLASRDADGIPLVHASYTGVVTDLPGAKPGVLLIVSQLTAAAAQDRSDLVFPIEKRDPAGRVLGCSGFATFHDPRNLT